MDENELISGDAPWGVIRETKSRPCQWLCWRWLDIGGGGPVISREPGTALFEGIDTQQFVDNWWMRDVEYVGKTDQV